MLHPKIVIAGVVGFLLLLWLITNVKVESASVCDTPACTAEGWNVRYSCTRGELILTWPRGYGGTEWNGYSVYMCAQNLETGEKPCPPFTNTDIEPTTGYPKISRWAMVDTYPWETDPSEDGEYNDDIEETLYQMVAVKFNINLEANLKTIYSHTVIGFMATGPSTRAYGPALPVIKGSVGICKKPISA